MKTYTFPVSIGDKVKAKVKDGDKVDEVSYLVHGVAQIGDKQYVIDESGEMFEIGSDLCLVDEHTNYDTPVYITAACELM